MKILFPIIELIDRYTIALVKMHKTGKNFDELDFYQSQINNLNLSNIQHFVDQLVLIHTEIWELEAKLKSGNEQDLPLEEIGRRAVAIRNKNNKRITLKNKISEIINLDTVREIKQDHLSE